MCQIRPDGDLPKFGHNFKLVFEVNIRCKKSLTSMIQIYSTAILYDVVQMWPDLKKKTGIHKHNIELTILPEMDCWLNALSYSTVCCASRS